MLIYILTISSGLNYIRVNKYKIEFYLFYKIDLHLHDMHLNLEAHILFSYQKTIKSTYQSLCFKEFLYFTM